MATWFHTFKDDNFRDEPDQVHLMGVDVIQHNVEISANLQAWKSKPLLRKIYAGFYAEIARHLAGNTEGPTVELGSGMGNLKMAIPNCITTDIFPNPWLDQVENAYRLSFADKSVANLVLFDVWHHLRYPGAALREFHRVLSDSGRLIIFEPAMGCLGRLIYSCFHHEPVAMKEPISWDAPPSFNPSELDYYAAQGNAERVFGRTPFTAQLRDWQITSRHYFSSISYLGSGGFSGPQVYPEGWLPAVHGLEKILDRAPRLFASRMLVVLEKQLC